MRVKYKKFLRPFFVFNCGGGQDARATLIGNTVFDKNTGTVFHPSSFVNAIQTKNAIILLDELTRGNYDFWNILLPVLDQTQRCLRLDEQVNSPVIKVGTGVTFIATANIGNEYTATRVLDKAISGRFPVKIEMGPISSKELEHLLNFNFPTASSSQKRIFSQLASIMDDILFEYNREDSEISSPISTRAFIHMGQLVMDGFSLEEIGEVAIYPEYLSDGGVDSERSFIKMLLQKYLPSDATNPVAQR